MRKACCVNCGKICENGRYYCNNKCELEWENKKEVCDYCNEKLSKINKLPNQPIHIKCRYDTLKKEVMSYVDNRKAYKKDLKSIEKAQKLRKKELKELYKKYNKELVLEAI